MLRRTWMALSLTLITSACGGGELQQVQQQQAGDYTITVLSDSGSVKNGSTDLTIEFRRTADNELVDVGTVDIAPVMDMPGMSPMMGTATVTPTDTPGRYRATSSLTMAGLWKFNLKFGDGQSVRMNVNAE